jgi:mono/diheme cytochrome c family protein
MKRRRRDLTDEERAEVRQELEQLQTKARMDPKDRQAIKELLSARKLQL